MARMIELSGSPGAGKTTIYREINSRWKKKLKWVPSHYLYPQTNLNLEYITHLVSMIRKRLNGKPVGMFDKVKSEARNKFLEQHPDYIDVCWNDIFTKQKKSINGLDCRLFKAQQLADMIENIQFIKESKTNKIAILEEGLIHLIDVLNFCDNKEHIQYILKVIPLPDAVVHIQVDIDENVQRLINRGDPISIHKCLNYKELEKITRRSQARRTMINEALQERNVPILFVDSKERVKENASKIIAFAESLVDNLHEQKHEILSNNTNI